MSGLKSLQEKYPTIGDVRGLGLMIATEFTDAQGKADPHTASKVLKACLNQNLLLLLCGSYKNVVRWIPPLVVNEKQIEEALGIYERALQELNKDEVGLRYKPE